MSQTFGEIVEPDTRAFWDNYEDFQVKMEDENRKRLELVWSKNYSEQSIPEQFKTFLIVEGTGITNLINALVAKHPQLCKITDSDIVIYQISDDLIICASTNRDLNKTGEATNLLLPFVQRAQEVIGISISPSASFNGRFDDKSDCIIRHINSSLSDIKPLRVPNIISGIVAGCITYRLFGKQDASAYACFVANPFFDLVQVKPIIDLLEMLQIPVTVQSTPSRNYDSGLYM